MSPEQRLELWMAERDRRRRSQAIGEFGTSVAARSKSPYLRRTSCDIPIAGCDYPSCDSRGLSRHGSGRHGGLSRHGSGRHGSRRSPAEDALIEMIAKAEMSPPEKERRRIVILVTIVALGITVLAALLVGLSLGLTPILDNLIVHRTLNNSLFLNAMNSTSSPPSIEITELFGPTNVTDFRP